LLGIDVAHLGQLNRFPFGQLKPLHQRPAQFITGYFLGGVIWSYRRILVTEGIRRQFELAI
jgi:hypothetical protein